MKTDEPIPLRSKRLRSLDEFEPPSWLGLITFGESKERLWPVVIVGLSIGAVIGWLLVLSF